jgi:hypothetical protein
MAETEPVKIPFRELGTTSILGMSGAFIHACCRHACQCVSKSTGTVYYWIMYYWNAYN